MFEYFTLRENLRLTFCSCINTFLSYFDVRENLLESYWETSEKVIAAQKYIGSVSWKNSLYSEQLFSKHKKVLSLFFRLKFPLF